MQNIITTSQIVYPILLAGKFGKFGFRKSASELIERPESLRRLNGVDWLKLIDRDFNLYRMRNLKAICGAGRWFGYFFEGPFLSRRVIYQADLDFVKTLALEEVGDLILQFMRSTQGFRTGDEKLFRAKLAGSENMRSLEDVSQFFENLKWGDYAEDNEKSETDSRDI